MASEGRRAASSGSAEPAARIRTCIVLGGVEGAQPAQAPGGEGQLLDPVLLGRVGGGVAGEEGGAQALVGGGVLAGEEAEGAGEAVAGAVQGGAGLALGGGGAAGEGAVGAEAEDWAAVGERGMAASTLVTVAAW